MKPAARGQVLAEGGTILPVVICLACLGDQTIPPVEFFPASAEEILEAFLAITIGQQEVYLKIYKHLARCVRGGH